MPATGVCQRRSLQALAVLAGISAMAAPVAATAQPGTLEAVYVVLGGDGAVARAILSGTDQCPAISLGSATQPMQIRAVPDAGANPAFPVLVCEAPIPADTVSAEISGRNLPLPKAAIATIAVFGDTGCRLKDAEAQRLDTRNHDHPHDGQFQDCDEPAQWPFPDVSRSVAATKPDLVIHVGDYLYRESACPAGDTGCKGSPHGDNWRTWKADFFAPAAPLLAAALWVVVRGNHETCARAGLGYFRFLFPVLASVQPPPTSSKPPACTDLTPPYTINAGGRSFLVIDSSNAYDSCAEDACDSPPYAAQFDAMAPKPGTWFLSHRPIWGVGRNFTMNHTLQLALDTAANGRLPSGITLVLSGHMHIFEALSFADARPPQLIVGTGGTALDRPIDRAMQGMTIGGATIRAARSDHRFGFLLIRTAAEGAAARFIAVGGQTLFTCALAPDDVTCR
ncbi:MAG: metallophosphoesterase [Xanthobacteraceae bacterium]